MTVRIQSEKEREKRQKREENEKKDEKDEKTKRRKEQRFPSLSTKLSFSKNTKGYYLGRVF
jgi:hypothetical protein